MIFKRLEGGFCDNRFNFENDAILVLVFKFQGNQVPPLLKLNKIDSVISKSFKI